MSNSPATTWDGLPISPEAPFGASIIVYRRGPQGIEFLLLHRAHHGPDYEGDWAWTPPAGSRWPNEPVEECARRELMEEAGLILPLRATALGHESWALYCAEAGVEQRVTLHDVEHDRYEWVSLETALARCLPERVAQSIRTVAQLL